MGKWLEGIVGTLIGAAVSLSTAYYSGHLDLKKDKRIAYQSYAVSLKSCTQAAKPNDYDAWAEECGTFFKEQVTVESFLHDNDLKKYKSESLKWYCYMHIYTGKFNPVRKGCADFKNTKVDSEVVGNLWPSLQETVRKLLIE